MPFGPRRDNGLLELAAQKKLEQLVEDAAESRRKGLASKMSVELVALADDPKRGQPFAVQDRKSNSDKSELEYSAPFSVRIAPDMNVRQLMLASRVDVLAATF